MRRMTIDEYISRWQTIEGNKATYDKTRIAAKGIRVLSTARLPFTCPTHGTFYKIVNSFDGCPACKAQRASNEKLEEARRSLKKLFSSNPYNSTLPYLRREMTSIKGVRLTVRCEEHGDNTLGLATVQKARGCPVCVRSTTNTLNRVDGNETLRSKKINEFLTKAAKVHRDKCYTYPKIQDEYFGVTSHVTMFCPEHGGQRKYAASILSGEGCPVCSNVYKGMSNLLSTNEDKRVVSYTRYIRRIKRRCAKTGVSFVEDFAGYVNRASKLKLHCQIHGYFTRSYHYLVNGNTSPCPECRADAKKASSDKHLSLQNNPELRKQAIKDFLRKARKQHNNAYSYEGIHDWFKKVSSPVYPTCKIHGQFRLEYGHNHLAGAMCPKCRKSGSSRHERELAKFIENLVGPDEILTNDRFVLEGLELDIYLPNYNLAIEYCGVFWHASDGNSLVSIKPKNYHRDKMLLCAEKGIRLFTIFDKDLQYHREAVFSRLRHALGITVTSINTRKCSVVKLSKKLVDKALNKWHTQGKVSSQIRYGLVDIVDGKRKLVALATYGKPRYAKSKYQYELLRFVIRPGYSVPGALPKMQAQFIRDFEVSSIVSYADKRWGTGDSYKWAGYFFSHTTAPAPWYAYKSGGVLLHRSHIWKNNQLATYGDYDDTLSQRENAFVHGLIEIYDCGTDVWTWHSSDK